MEWVSFTDGMSVSKYPATVSDFAVFLNSDAYHRRESWSERGWDWRSKTQSVKPTYWGLPEYSDPGLPVTGVSFWEAEAFANFMHARLPNELEWYALASNARGDKYPWGQDAPTQDKANLAFFGRYAQSRRTAVVNSFKGASLAGVCDLIGNVSEWCLPDACETLAHDAAYAVLRGGACWHTPLVVDNKFRDCVTLSTRDNQTGIRLVRGQSPAIWRAELATSYKRMEPGHYAASDGIDIELVRPTRSFRQEGLPAVLREDQWRLIVDGCVQQPLELSLESLSNDWPVQDATNLFVCVCRWGDITSVRGVPLHAIIEAVQPTVDVAKLYLHQRSVVGVSGKAYTSCVQLAKALNNQALLCYEMNDQPLSMELGWPLRYLDFSLYGYKQVKCLERLTISERFEIGWWEEAAGYDPDGTILPGDVTVVGRRASGYTLL